ncbi:hypothetical protein BJ165DRAFT_1535414 [Panaeolus papilionaceus]|nr:hypothetical protein BJ165DRAFT_1535414 [Panaeolus papilionaceus]
MQKVRILVRKATSGRTIKVIQFKGIVPNHPVYSHIRGNISAYSGQPKEGRSMGFVEGFYRQHKLKRESVMIHELTHIFIDTVDVFEHPEQKIVGSDELAGMQELQRLLPKKTTDNADSYSIAAIRATWLCKYGPNYYGFRMTVSNAIRASMRKNPKSDGRGDLKSKVELFPRLLGIEFKNNLNGTRVSNSEKEVARP